MTPKLVQPPPIVPPAKDSVAWAFRELQAAADARSKRDDVTPTEAGRCAYLAWFAAVAAELLATPDGCALTGLATAQDLVAGAMWIADRHAMLPERRDQERAAFLRGIVALLPQVGEEGQAQAIIRLWTTLTANLIVVCTSGKIPLKMQRPYLEELQMWSREATWIAGFDLIAASEYAEWIDELVPSQEACDQCGRQGTADHPNGSHPASGQVACFNHRDALPPVVRPDDAPHAVASVVVATTPDDRIVLVQGPEHFNLPGGKREPNETAAQAAQRELGEEARLRVPERALRFVGTAATHDGRPMAVYACAVPPPPGEAWTGEGECRVATREEATACYRPEWLAAFHGVMEIVDLAAGRAPASASTLPQPADVPPAAPPDSAARAICEQCHVLPVEAGSRYCGVVCQLRAERAAAESA